MRLRYHCHFGSNTGYARAAHDYLLALSTQTDVELQIVPIGVPVSDAAATVPTEERFAPLARFTQFSYEDRPDVEIYHTTPRALSAADWAEDSATKKVAMTTWETDTLPDDYVLGLTEYDGVIVPSEFCKVVIGPAIDQAYVVPHCFDPGHWVITPESESDKYGPYRFYTIGAWGERKNIEGLIRAYLHEFGDTDYCELMIISGNCDYNAARAIVARSGIPADELPAMTIADGWISDGDLFDLHDGGDCFVSATRGEGFGLGLFEAAIMGNHVIAPTKGGQNEFLYRHYSFGFVGSSMTPCFGAEKRGEIVRGPNGGMYQKSTVIMPPGVNARQLWAEPDLEGLAYEMREAYARRLPNKETRAELPGERASRAHLEEQFGYKPVAKLLVDTLERIS